MPTSTNRTKWPTQGGAIAVQPGWFPGHHTAFFYFNLGLGAIPPNMSHPMLPPFQIIGPTANPYPGTFCLPQVPLPAGVTVNVGDLATIQVIETAVHGAALYNVRSLPLYLRLFFFSHHMNWLPRITQQLTLTENSVLISNSHYPRIAKKSRQIIVSIRAISDSPISTRLMRRPPLQTHLLPVA